MSKKEIFLDIYMCAIKEAIIEAVIVNDKVK